jgi:glutamate--cysteine ligase
MTRVPGAVASQLRDEIHALSFTPSGDVHLPRIGAEVEFLVLDATSRRPVPLETPGRSLIGLVREHAESLAWHEGRTGSGTPKFEAPGQAVLTFEPGGQIEISTTAGESPNALLATLEAIISPLRRRLADNGVDLLAAGIDPETPIECVPLQLHVDRYERMTRYFDRIGPFGVRMMRQTAAVQISLDRGARPNERWRLLNNLTPFLVAIFANSPRYTSQDSRHKSFRARCWRMLDSTRTGIVDGSGDPAASYTTFALGAHDMMREDASGAYRPFGEWVAAGDWSHDRWALHLTTLFPEVRPRGHFEVRSCDALDPSWYPALVVFLVGLAYDERSAREAGRLVQGKGELLSRAGQCGLTDSLIARTARDLAQLALDGASRFPSEYLHPSHIERAREIVQAYTFRGLSPADDASSSGRPAPTPRHSEPTPLSS